MLLNIYVKERFIDKDSTQNLIGLYHNGIRNEQHGFSLQQWNGGGRPIQRGQAADIDMLDELPGHQLPQPDSFWPTPRFFARPAAVRPPPRARGDNFHTCSSQPRPA